MNYNLLICRRPDLIPEWDLDKNKKLGIEIKTITYSSHKKVYWKCLKNKNHKSYLASPNNKTYKTLNKSSSGCRQCSYDHNRVHDKKELYEKRNSIKSVINTTLIGDMTEKYIKELLINSNKFKNIKIVGNIGGNGDICITDYKNNINYIQVKTLTYNRNDIYYMTNNFKYPDNMLIVMVNKQRNRFALEFAGNIKVKRLSLVYDYKKSKYQNIMYKSVECFLEDLIKKIPMSCSRNKISSSIFKEISMLNRFEKFCIDRGIKYERNDTNGNCIDGTINGYKFQAKFVSFSQKNQKTFNVTFCKSAGRLNNKNITRNYEKGEIDFVIIETGGTRSQPNKYKGHFCIIPENKLIEQGILKTENTRGKKSFYICPPLEYNKEHWSKKFWNNTSGINI